MTALLKWGVRVFHDRLSTPSPWISIAIINSLKGYNQRLISDGLYIRGSSAFNMLSLYRVAIRKPEDDWTGTTDRAERRKLQNRLNQRTYRMRQQAQNSEDKAQLHSNKTVVVPPNSTPIRIDRDERGFTCSIAPPQFHSMMRQFESLALGSYIRNSPNIGHLLSLSKLNIQHAIIENTRSIAVQDIIDEDDLCHDLMAFWDTRNTGATLLVWGPSWEPENWEVTPAFLLKWGFLLKDI
ncbi:hypothetical protein E8E15_006818 [Penicillium rubens]|nr:hypothetical protein E8E15_006818 [Penicillium rubens]